MTADIFDRGMPDALSAVVIPTLVGDEIQVSVTAIQTLTVKQAKVLARQIIATAEWAATENGKTRDALWRLRYSNSKSGVAT